MNENFLCYIYSILFIPLFIDYRSVFKTKIKFRKRLTALKPTKSKNRQMKLASEVHVGSIMQEQGLRIADNSDRMMIC